MPQNLVEWAILVVAAVQCLTFLALLVLLVLLLKAFLYIRRHVPPIVGTVEGTLGTVSEAAGNVRETTVRVRGTAAFLTEYAVQPVILVAGMLAGIRQTVRALLRRRGRRG